MNPALYNTKSLFVEAWSYDGDPTTLPKWVVDLGYTASTMGCRLIPDVSEWPMVNSGDFLLRSESGDLDPPMVLDRATFRRLFRTDDL